MWLKMEAVHVVVVMMEMVQVVKVEQVVRLVVGEVMNGRPH